jgi:hypothetical protein
MSLEDERRRFIAQAKFSRQCEADLGIRWLVPAVDAAGRPTGEYVAASGYDLCDLGPNGFGGPQPLLVRLASSCLHAADTGPLSRSTGGVPGVTPNFTGWLGLTCSSPAPPIRTREVIESAWLSDAGRCSQRYRRALVPDRFRTRGVMPLGLSRCFRLP